MEYRGQSVGSLNIEGISHLVNGNLQPAVQKFQAALQGLMAETTRQNMTPEEKQAEGITSNSSAAIALAGSERRRLTVKCARIPFTSYKRHDEDEERLFTHALYLEGIPEETWCKDTELTAQHLAVILFNIGLTYHQRGRRQADQGPLRIAVRFYYQSLDLLMHDLSSSSNQPLSSTAIFPILQNTAHAIFELGEFHQAEEILMELVGLMERTTDRPPAFEDQHVHSMLLFFLLDAIPHHAAAA